MTKNVYTCSNCGAPAKKTGGDSGGLGTWHCTAGCPKRRFSIERFIGSGKEADKKRIEGYPVRRAIAVKRAKVTA